jgi:hypothetical protein
MGHVLRMTADRPGKKPVASYRTKSGIEVVCDWLRSLDEGANMKKKTARSTKELTTLDDFLKGEGKLEEFEAVAIKEVLAWQIGEAMKRKIFRASALPSA